MSVLAATGWVVGYTIGIVVVLVVVALVVPILVLAHRIGRQAGAIDASLRQSVHHTAALAQLQHDHRPRDRDHRRPPARSPAVGRLR